jgi:hypothetical protein
MSQGITKYDSDGANMSPLDGDANILTQIASGVNRIAGVPGFTPAQGIPITQPTITPNFFAPASTTPVVIPIGAIGASVLILTGTGTLNGVDQPVGVPWTEPNNLAATVTLVLGSPGTARVYYGT